MRVTFAIYNRLNVLIVNAQARREQDERMRVREEEESDLGVNADDAIGMLTARDPADTVQIEAGEHDDGIVSAYSHQNKHEKGDAGGRVEDEGGDSIDFSEHIGDSDLDDEDAHAMAVTLNAHDSEEDDDIDDIAEASSSISALEQYELFLQTDVEDTIASEQEVAAPDADDTDNADDGNQVEANTTVDGIDKTYPPSTKSQLFALIRKFDALVDDVENSVVALCYRQQEAEEDVAVVKEIRASLLPMRVGAVSLLLRRLGHAVMMTEGAADVIPGSNDGLMLLRWWKAGGQLSTNRNKVLDSTLIALQDAIQVR